MSWSVLIVDDELRTRDVYRLMLEFAGYRVIEAVDGYDALNKVKEYAPDAVLLDIMMPDMDGYMVCKKLRQDAATADLPIIMFSGKVRLDAVTEALNAGANRYLPKPLSFNDLIQTMHEVLGHPSKKSEPDH
jgi:CheY-like chemotaxis protein